MDLSRLTPAKIRAMTKQQLEDAILEDRTETKVTVSTGDRRGQLREVREARDVGGNLLGSSETTWTYWPNGNVDTITTREKDKNGVVIGKPKVVKHRENGGLHNES